MASKKGQTGAHGPQSIPEAVQQIAFADRILLNKTDLVSAQELDAARTALSDINPQAQILTSLKCAVPLVELLNIRAFDASRNAELLLAAASAGAGLSGGGAIGITRGAFHIETDAAGRILSGVGKGKRSEWVSGRAAAEAQSAPKETGAVSTVSLTCSEPLDLNVFNVWIASLLQDKGNDLYRFKGDRNDTQMLISLSTDLCVLSYRHITHARI